MPFPRAVARLFAGSMAVANALAADSPVSFRQDVAPLLQRRCVACHGEESAKGGYRLDSFARLLKAGESDLPPVVAGKAPESELYRLLAEPEARDRMPQKAEALPAHEVALIERWLQQGAINDGGAPDRPLVELIRETFLRPAPKTYSHPVPVTALAFSPDGTQLAVSGSFEVTLWNLADGALAQRIGGLPERITAIAWSAERNLLAVAGGSPAQWGTVALVDPAAGFQTRLLCDLAETALNVAFSPDGSRLAAGCGDRTIRLFSMPDGKQLRVLRPHADWVQSVAFSPDGTKILSASRDRTVRISNAKTGEVETTYTHHDAPALAAIFSRDGKTILSLATARNVHLWEAATGELKKKAIELPARPECLALVSGVLATGSADGLVRTHQTTDRQTLLTLFGHADAINALAVDPAGKTLASGSYDGTVCVWDLACGTWTHRFTASP